MVNQGQHMTEKNSTAVAATAFETYREVSAPHPAGLLTGEEVYKHPNSDLLVEDKDGP
jgi:hypothetical protein